MTSLDHSVRIMYMYNILGSQPPRLLLQFTYWFSGVTALLCFLFFWQLISIIFLLPFSSHTHAPWDSLRVLLSSDSRLLGLFLYFTINLTIPRSTFRPPRPNYWNNARNNPKHKQANNKQPTLVCTCYTVHTAVWSPILLFAYIYRTNERTTVYTTKRPAPLLLVFKLLTADTLPPLRYINSDPAASLSCLPPPSVSHLIYLHTPPLPVSVQQLFICFWLGPSRREIQKHLSGSQLHKTKNTYIQSGPKSALRLHCRTLFFGARSKATLPTSEQKRKTKRERRILR